MSRKIIVSLISDQTIPNLEFIKEKIDDIDALLFITTEDMERSGNKNWILNALAINIQYDSVIVNAFSFDDIELKLNEIVNDEDLYIVNLTGGTKIMSLAVYDFFKSVNSEMYYLTGRGKYIKVHPGRNKPEYDLKSKTTLQDYMVAYGFEITNKSKPIRDYQYCKIMLQYFLHKFNKENDPAILKVLRDARSKGIKDNSKETGLTDFIDRLDFKPKNENKLSKYECRYLSGDWLEEYLYHFLKENLEIPDYEIGIGWNVKKYNNTNEFDVLLMKNNKLYLFECKTSIYLDADETRTFITDTVYKSDSLRNKLGLFAQSIVFTLSDLDKPKMEIHTDRATASKVKLIGRNLIKDKNNLINYLKKI